MNLQESKEYLIFLKERYTRMSIVRRWKLNSLNKFLETSGYQLDKTEVTGLALDVDFMSVIDKSGFKKRQKIKDGLKKLWNSNLAQSNAKRI